ncbi:MAG: ParB N-terminal domain-containing protein [Algicola sp.]|nr:ParB N-terminal domain-containing protein [Algicola sp.]
MLDPSNYRLDYTSQEVELDDSEVKDLQSDTQKRLEKERLAELRDSILQNGFLEVDRIVVRKLDVEINPPLYMIVEGNRRAAAFKGLIEEHNDGEIRLPKVILNMADSIGVICVEGSSDEISDYSAALMGIRHVSGPKKWAGFQSARLINELFEKGKKLTEIGALLAIGPKDAGRRMRGYKAFMQMRGDKEFGQASATNHYALFLEFLAPSQVGRDWLQWNNSTYKFEHRENLVRLYSGLTTNTGDLPPEIKNIDAAREFLAKLQIEHFKLQIEAGTRLHALLPEKIKVHTQADTSAAAKTGDNTEASTQTPAKTGDNTEASTQTPAKTGDNTEASTQTPAGDDGASGSKADFAPAMEQGKHIIVPELTKFLALLTTFKSPVLPEEQKILNQILLAVKRVLAAAGGE